MSINQLVAAYPTRPDVDQIRDAFVEVVLSARDVESALDLHEAKPSILSAALVELCRRELVAALREMSDDSPAPVGTASAHLLQSASEIPEV